jgi:hypothetical protein
MPSLLITQSMKLDLALQGESVRIHSFTQPLTEEVQPEYG